VLIVNKMFSTVLKYYTVGLVYLICTCRCTTSSENNWGSLLWSV